MKALLFGSGAAILVAGAVAFAFSQGGREIEVPEAAAVERQDAPTETAQLVAVEPIEEPEPEASVALPPGYMVDEDGHVWEPLTNEPQLKNNGDGTVTMRKLARIYEADGSMREIPIRVTAHPIQKRVPLKKRELPAHMQKQVDAEAEEAQEDGQ